MSRRSLFAAPVLALVLAAPATADWFAPGSPVTTDTNALGIVGTVSDPAGGVIVVFTVASGASVGLSAQRIGIDGSHAWGPTGVVVLPPTPDFNQAGVVTDGQGGAIVHWFIRSGISSQRAYAQRVDPNGLPQWGPSGVLLRDTWEQTGGLQVAATHDGMLGGIFAITTRLLDGGDIYAQRVDPWGTPQWGMNGTVVCDATGTQQFPVVTVSDAGAAIIAWQDGRTSPNLQIFAQRISALGPAWADDGISLCNAGSTRAPIAACTDGGTGAIVVWTDARTGASGLYARRVTDAGTPMWTADGLRLSLVTGGLAQTIPDGYGGVYVVWPTGGSESDIGAQYVDNTGTRVWGTAGVTVCGAPGAQTAPVVARDSYVLDLYVMWEDLRAGGSVKTLYAQRIDGFLGTPEWPANGRPVTDGSRNCYTPRIQSGFLGGALFCYNADPSPPLHRAFADRLYQRGLTGPFAPRTTVATDRPNDEGGWVRITMDTPWADPALYLHTVTGYNLWRQVLEPGPAPAPLDRAGVAAAVARSERERVTITTAGNGEFPDGTWESLGFHMAVQSGQYHFAAPTARDSNPDFIPTEFYLISTHTPTPGLYLVGDLFGGYSVDNLAPGQPSPFEATLTGSGTTAGTTLTWGASPEPDLLEYRLHRGPTADFVPGPGNLVATLAATGFFDDGQFGPHYKLAAVDRHGNVSPYAPASVAVVSVAPAGARELRFEPPRPHPLQGAGRFLLAMPADAPVSLAAFDVTGRRVRVLAEGMLPAGEHPIEWDGRDSHGRALPAGVYHVRLRAGAEQRTLRVVLSR